ncbi:unnamed protein product, partial [Ectocarpus sp. 6 AP-2014]
MDRQTVVREHKPQTLPFPGKAPRNVFSCCAHVRNVEHCYWLLVHACIPLANPELAASRGLETNCTFMFSRTNTNAPCVFRLSGELSCPILHMHPSLTTPCNFVCQFLTRHFLVFLPSCGVFLVGVPLRHVNLRLNAMPIPML